MSSTISRAAGLELVLTAKSQAQRPAFVNPGDRALNKLEELRKKLNDGAGPLDRQLMDEMRLLKHFCDLAHPTKCPEAYVLWSFAWDEIHGVNRLLPAKAIKRARVRWSDLRSKPTAGPKAKMNSLEMSPA